MEEFEASLRCVQCDVQRDINDLVLCSTCSHQIPRDYYCKYHCIEEDCNHQRDCTLTSHQTCWARHLMGFSSKARPNHEQSPALADACMQIIIPHSTDYAAQKQSHADDRAAEWFRISLASLTALGSEPLLQISDRYRRICNPGQTEMWNLQNCPSLVSFVGDTGAGKSTLVRAMMAVGATDQTNGNDGHARLRSLFHVRANGPVTKSTLPEHALMPTSIGVHLYRDRVIQSVRLANADRVDEVPVLYADCEGFSAATTRTGAEHASGSENSPASQRHRSYSGTSIGSRLVPTPNVQNSSNESTLSVGMDDKYVVREIIIRTPGFKDRGKQSAEAFYAKFLYAFSDVIVFVLREDQKMKHQLQTLLERVVSAVKGTGSRSSPKTLIIVRNGPSSHSEASYEEMDLRHPFFTPFGPVWDDSRKLMDYKTWHDNRCSRFEDRIHTNANYFGLFFGKVLAFYIPNKHHAPGSAILQQYSRLRKHILEGVVIAHQHRSLSWRRYDASSLDHLTNRAFEHFANSDQEFDFHAAGKRNNPTPVSIPGHIANLLRNLTPTLDNLQKFEDLVAICLISFFYRESDYGRNPDGFFDENLSEKCKRGIKIYQRDFQQCSLLMGNKGRCVKYQYNHTEQHCSSHGDFWAGSWEDKEFAKPIYEVINGIKAAFRDMYHELYPQNRNKPLLERLCRYRATILKRERDTVPPNSSRPQHRIPISIAQFVRPRLLWTHTRSNMTCFACLQFAPDHILPCGHGFCEDCIKDFGTTTASRRYNYTLGECVLCGANAQQWLELVNAKRSSAKAGNGESPLQPLPLEKLPPQIIRVVPRCAGVRVLTLDGGGVRGVIELAILQKIQKRVGLDIPFGDLFDLVVGTSTGGIISLALAMDPNNHSLHDLHQKFCILAKDTFEKDRFRLLWGVDLLGVLPREKISSIAMIFRVVTSRYKSSSLRKSLQKIFYTNQPIFGDCTTTGNPRRLRVAVTSTNDGEPCVFTNYSRLSHQTVDGVDRTDGTESHMVIDKGFERQEDPDHDARTWEAGMATSAAPGYFHEWKIDDFERRRRPKVPFVDGACHANLPVEYALAEKERIWPRYQGYARPLDLLVSVGCGKLPGELKMPDWMRLAPANTMEPAKAYIRMIFNTDSVWESFCRSGKFDPQHHFRLQTDLKKKVNLDDWTKMQDMINEVDQQYNASRAPGSFWARIEITAYRLTAGLLFFEPVSIKIVPPNREWIEGYIWCRLEIPSLALQTLVDRIEDFCHKEGDRPLTSLTLPPRWRQDVQSRSEFAIPCAIGKTNDPSTRQILGVKLRPPNDVGDARFFPISGFPITYDELRACYRNHRGVKDYTKGYWKD